MTDFRVLIDKISDFQGVNHSLPQTSNGLLLSCRLVGSPLNQSVRVYRISIECDTRPRWAPDDNAIRAARPYTLISIIQPGPTNVAQSYDYCAIRASCAGAKAKARAP